MKDKIDFAALRQAIDKIEPLEFSGKVEKIIGLSIESAGPKAEIGEICRIYPQNSLKYVEAEVIGFAQHHLLLMPYGSIKGISIGSKVIGTGRQLSIDVSDKLMGRVVDGLGNPIDSKGDIRNTESFPIDADPPNPLMRKRISAPIQLGVRAMDGLLTCGEGQRIGVFAGSGVGKSTLLGMIARNANADVNVIGLVGERGREVNEFLANDLRAEGLQKSVVVVATSDQPALIRAKAAMTATTIAEYFREQGKTVLLMMDSLTRFAMAQREVSLATGEPPVSRGYTPSVFATLPRLLERTGCSSKSSITAIYTVLVEGDEMNEPISDAVRGILDGHVVLSRKLASANHYPAIDVLASVSRVMPAIVSSEHRQTASRMRDLMATYEDAKDLIDIGAYKKGSNIKIDQAIEKHDKIEAFLKQGMNETNTFRETVQQLLNCIA